jgi:hypothetical protein
MAKTIGGWWLRREALHPGEICVAHWNVNRTQGSRRSVGGRLFLTSQRLVFLPHLLDATLGGASWVSDRSSIVSLAKEPRGRERLAGGLRERLKLVLSNGEQELFVVRDVDRVIEELTSGLESGRNL